VKLVMYSTAPERYKSQQVGGGFQCQWACLVGGVAQGSSGLLCVCYQFQPVGVGLIGRCNTIHSKEIWIYVFQEKELRGISCNFHFYVSMSDLYIPTFGPPTFLQQNRQTDQGNMYVNRSQKHQCRNWDCSRAVPFLGIVVSNLRYCVFAVCIR